MEYPASRVLSNRLPKEFFRTRIIPCPQPVQTGLIEDGSVRVIKAGMRRAFIIRRKDRRQ